MDSPVDLIALANRVVMPDEEARRAAYLALDRLAKPPGSLGRLEELAIWLAGCQGACPTRPIEHVRAVVVAGDHGVAAAGVSAFPSSVTQAMVGTVVAGAAAVNVLADVVGATVRVVDAAVDADPDPDLPVEVTKDRVRRSSGRIDREDALSRDEADAAFALGVRLADEEVDAGADLLVLGDLGIANTTPAAVLTALLTRCEVVDVVGRGTGIDDHGWMRKAAAVRDAARRGRPLLADRIGLLSSVGGADLAAMTGFLVGAAARRTPVVLDGVVVAAAALVAQRVAYRSPRWWVAGHLSPEPAHAKALERLGLEPVVDLKMRLGEGTGALMAVPAVVAASRLLAGMAGLGDVVPANDDAEDGEAAGADWSDIE